MERIFSFTAGTAENVSAAALAAGMPACFGKYIVYILMCAAAPAVLLWFLPRM